MKIKNLEILTKAGLPILTTVKVHYNDTRYYDKLPTDRFWAKKDLLQC